MGGKGSGSVCSVCTHAERQRIDEDLCFDPNVRAIAGRYEGLTKSSVDRHYRAHMALSKEERGTARLAAIARHIAETRAKAPEVEAQEHARETELEALRSEVSQLRQTKRGVLDQWKQIEALNGVVWEIIHELRDAKKMSPGEGRLDRFDQTLKATREVARQLELQGKFLGEIMEGAQVQVVLLTAHPDWVRIRDGLVSLAQEEPVIGTRLLALLPGGE